MTWDDCNLVERVPGLVDGRPVVKGTRVEPQTILMDYELGSPIEDIHGNFPSIPVGTIRELLRLAGKLPGDLARRRALDELVRAEMEEGLYDRVPLNAADAGR